MTNPMAPGIPLAIAVVAALAAAALRAAARRRERQGVPAAEPAPVTVTAGEGRAPRAVEQAQHIFHELHADGRNALCAVCDSQYGPAGPVV